MMGDALRVKIGQNDNHHWKFFGNDRTARGKSGKGKALLMLMPEELKFLQYLKV